MKLFHLPVFFLFATLLTWSACNDSGQHSEELLREFEEDSTLMQGQRNQGDEDHFTEEIPFYERLNEYESKDRVFWQKPNLVIDQLGDLSDKVVADIGAGSGYFSRRLAYKAKKVLAVDIEQRFIEFMDSIKVVELPEEFQDRFETRLAEPMDAKLNPNEVDVVLIVNTYIYLADRVAYLKHLKPSLKKGGRLVIVDFKKKRIPMNQPPAELRIPLYQVEMELTTAGYRLLRSDDTSLDYQYIIIATI
jgi:SAM-dependent methyltransferase